MAKSKHDKIAERLARQEDTEYNRGQGADIKGQRRVIEVATSPADLRDSKRQLQGYRKPRYLATTPDLIDTALEITAGTKIGVKGPTGKIHRRAGGGPRKR